MMFKKGYLNMNKEELITNKINSLKCRGKYNLDIKESISNMLFNFTKLKHKILKGNYKVKNNLNKLIHYAVNVSLLKQYNYIGYEDIKNKYEELEKLLIKKNTDYGNSFDKTLDEYGLNIALVRIEDKINRFKNLKDKADHKVDEDLKDTILDIAGYGVLFAIYLENKEDK
ncbi:nucleotide modification associated domain-containing protein [Brachyspira hampsonii]|uniref:nucleotide modification associated domain-containing protein n=1 Tax=Brachyspira hampsonii TaxID=1287055 RepID=UPI00210B9A59|nr:nucleotide modification associated domain-containing protein [Brachyspira hampsonii]